MINEKTAKRVEFASEYQGDDFVQNPQLRFMIAKSIEPMEIRHKLQKARQVQQAIIMQTEQHFTRLDEETYANLQPKVFRKEPDQDFKRFRVLDDRELAILEAKKQRKLQLQRQLEEKKKYEVDVRQKGKSTLSYSHFFKPPKPIATLAQVHFQPHQPSVEESNYQRQSSSVDALKGTMTSNLSKSFISQAQPPASHQRTKQGTAVVPYESQVLGANRSEKSLTAYERRQLGLDGNKRVLSSIQYAVMQDVNPELRRQAIQMIVKQARSMNPDKKGILRPIPGLKAPTNHKEALEGPKPYKYYGQRSLEDSDLDEEEPPEQKMVRELNTLIKEYDDEAQSKKLKDRIVKHPNLNSKKEELKYSLKNNRLDYDEKLEKVREEIQRQKEQVRSRNQPLDPGPQFPFIGDKFHAKSRNQEDLTPTLDLSSFQISSKQQITKLDTFGSYDSHTQNTQLESIGILSFRPGIQTQSNTLNSTQEHLNNLSAFGSVQKFQPRRQQDIHVSPFALQDSKIDVRQSLDSVPSLNSQVKIDIRRGHRAEMPTRNQTLYQQYSTQMHSKQLDSTQSKEDNFQGRFTATLTQSSEESTSPLRIPLRAQPQSQAGTNPFTTLNNSLDGFPFARGIITRDHSLGDLIDIRNQQESLDEVDVSNRSRTNKKKDKNPFSYQESLSRHSSRQVKFKIASNNFDSPAANKTSFKEGQVHVNASTHLSTQKLNHKEDNSSSQFLATPQQSNKSVRLPSISSKKNRAKGKQDSREPLKSVDWNNISDSTPALRHKQQEQQKDQLMNRNPQTTSKKLQIDAATGRMIITEAESYQHLHNSLPKIRLKSLKKTHEDFVAEQQKRFELEGREEHAMLMHKNQKEFFVKESKGGNKQYRVVDHYENDVMILKPVVDASDKEIFKRNGMSSAAEQLKQLVNAKERLLNQDKTFLPNQFGQESSPKNIGHKIVRNKIKQPPTAEEVEQGKSDLNEDREIIIRRQVDQLYQKMGEKLTNMLSHPVTMRMNLKLAAHFAGKLKVENMSAEEKERRIRAYLFDRISEQMERHENRNLTRQQLQQIDEQHEEEEGQSPRKPLPMPEQVLDDEVNVQELFLRQYEELRAKQEQKRLKNINKAYKKSVARQVKLGMVRGKHYDPQHKRDKGGMIHRDGDSVLEQINWQIDVEAHKRHKNKQQQEESSDEEQGGPSNNKKAKQLQFKQVQLKNEEDQSRANEVLTAKKREEDKLHKEKRLKEQVVWVRDEEERNFLRKILEERDAMEKNIHKMSKQMREEYIKERKLNRQEDDSDVSDLLSEEGDDFHGVYLFDLENEIQKLEDIEKEKEAEQVRGQIAQGLKEGLLRLSTQKDKDEPKPQGLGGLFKQLLANAKAQSAQKADGTQRSQTVDMDKGQAEVSMKLFDSIARAPSLKHLQSTISNSFLGTIRHQPTQQDDAQDRSSVHNLLFKNAVPQTPILKAQDTIVSEASTLMAIDPELSIINQFKPQSNLAQLALKAQTKSSEQQTAPKQPGLMSLLAAKTLPGEAKPSVPVASGGLFSNLKSVTPTFLDEEAKRAHPQNSLAKEVEGVEKETQDQSEQPQKQSQVEASAKLPPMRSKEKAFGIPLSGNSQGAPLKSSLSLLSQSIKASIMKQQEGASHQQESKKDLTQEKEKQTAGKESAIQHKELESLQKIQLLLQKATLGKIKELGMDVKADENSSAIGETSQSMNPLAALLQRGLSKKIKTQEEKDAERIDYRIHRENAVIQKVRDKLEENVKHRVGTGLSKGLLRLLEFQHSEKNGDRVVKGVISADYRRELANLKSKVHMIDDLFISKNGVKVKPERLKQHKLGEERGDGKLTEFEKLELRRKKLQKNGLDIEREVMKIKIHENREFFKNLENPENEVEKVVNDNIIADMRRKKKELIKFNLMDKPVLIKKLPLIDDLKFASMTVKSLALKKRIWKGDNGRYKATDLLKWFKVYEETKLLEIRKDLGKTEHGDGNSYYLKGDSGAPRKA